MGRHHSAVIVEAGHVYTFGRNTEGQLGTGNVKAFHAPMELKSLAHVSINVRFLLVVVFFLLLFFLSFKCQIQQNFNYPTRGNFVVIMAGS